MKTRNVHSRPKEPSIISYRELPLYSVTHDLGARHLLLPDTDLGYSGSAIL